MERLGLVGLPNAGKSSLFNALTGGNTPVAAHPFSTTETTVGVAQVPDKRLLALAEMSKSRKIVHTTVEFVDIAGLVAGAASGEGLGNRFLAGIREVDAICLVLRGFVDENVAGDADALADLQVLELELVLADLATVEGQVDKRRKAARADKSLAIEVEGLEAALDALQSGTPIYRSALARRPSIGVAAGIPADQQADPGGGQHRRGSNRPRGRSAQAGDRRARRRRRHARGQREAGSGDWPGWSRVNEPRCLTAWAWARARCPGSPGPPITCSAAGRS